MRRLLLGLALLAKLVHGTHDVAPPGRAVPVDFFVFLGKDGDAENVAPRASMDITPPDDKIGFSTVCKDECPVFQESCGANCLSPAMRWCRCIAEHIAKDLAFDFGALSGAGSSPVFTMGKYIEVSKGQDHFIIRDGHSTLYSLMEANASSPIARRSGRVAVWVAHHIQPADDPNSMLAGTTLLDQPLWKGGRGAGVLLHAGVDRSGKVLSHEIGHVVGFHHTAGPSHMHIYDHPECPKEYEHVEMHPLVFPSCEVNIMGYWYDGPYCCPGESPSFLQFLRGGRSSRKQCLANPLTNYQEAHCCGSECSHECSKQMPAPTFATKEHEDGLRKILKCWLHLRTVPETKAAPGAVTMMSMTNTVQRKSSVECFDYGPRGRKLGSCVTEPPP